MPLGTFAVNAREEILKRQAEEQAQAEKKAGAGQ
jgi:hypothetical protein